jgi:pSer/pThr/pTyr-binding forkhead associated (FHA) protein
MSKLILKRKAEVLREFSLQGTNSPFTIGSEPGNDVVVSDKLISMTHFQIERQGEQFFVRDLKSAFGTYVNGTKINSLQEIHDGDVIQVGEHALVFQNSFDSEGLRGNNSAVGQSISDFLSDVKEAVMNPADGETSPRPRLSEQAASTAKTEQEFRRTQFDSTTSRSAGNNRLAADELDINGIEDEISDVLNKAGVKRESSASAGASTTYKKSPY